MDSYADRLLQDVLCRGRGAGYGAAVGKIVFNLEDVNDFEEKDRIILCVTEINGHSDIQKSLKVNNFDPLATKPRLSKTYSLSLFKRKSKSLASSLSITIISKALFNDNVNDGIR